MLRYHSVFAIAAGMMTASSAAGQSLTKFEQVTARRDLSVGSNTLTKWVLGRVQDIVVGPRRNMYVLDRSTQTVLEFGWSGAFLSEFGGKGGGPGQFIEVSRLGVRGDSIVVTDGANGRITVFHGLKWQPVRTFSVSALEAQGRRLLVEAVLPDGLVLSDLPGPREPGATATLRFTTDDGERLAAPFPISMKSRAFAAPARIEGGEGITPRTTRAVRQLFAQPPMYQLDREGPSIVKAIATFLGASDPVRVDFVRRDLTGVERPFASVHVAGTRLTNQMVQHAIDSIARPAMLNGNMRLIVDRRVVQDSLLTPPFLPVMRRLFVGTGGAIVVVLPRTSTARNDYWWISGTGKPYAFHLPADFMPSAVFERYVIGWRVDADGNVLLERYEVLVK